MKKRYMASPIKELCFSDRKIAMLSGPRQCGKTTLSKMLLNERGYGTYNNWDEFDFRHEWARNPSSVVLSPKDDKDIPLIILDEIHKEHLWKRNLKGIYDTLKHPCDFLVTGSANLNIYRKNSDSMLGRFFHFRLHPFSINELSDKHYISPDDFIDNLFSRSKHLTSDKNKIFESMMKYGPFPEPFLKQNLKKARLWRQQHDEIIIREELRDISKLPDLGRIQMMATLLPERIGSLFSISNMRKILEIRYDTVNRWLQYLKELYYIFEIKPYYKSIPRSIRKAGKIYLWEYSGIKDESAKFENLVAHHLLKSCHYWTDTGEGKFQLHYLRDKEKFEIDFLITRDNEPWLPIEVKWDDTKVSPSWKHFTKNLPCEKCLQIVNKPIWKIHDFPDTQILVANAAETLSYFI